MSEPAHPAPGRAAVEPDPVPLVVDLDGTLIKTDLLFESVVRLLRRNPLYVFLLPLWLWRGKHVLKEELAARVQPDSALLPYQQTFLHELQRQHAQGRVLVLATATHARLAQAVAAHLGIFSQVLASDASRNLAGRRKAEALLGQYGTRGFDYAGNAAPDLQIWPHARHAILVNPDRGVERRARACATVTALYADRGSRLRLLLRALRAHQWSKNLLLFVALLAAHRWNQVAAVTATVLAFAAFSLCASAIYLVNDALDLESDRAHARKKRRPLAAGDLSLPAAAALVVCLLAGGLTLAALVSPAFVAVLLVYLATTCAYSFWLKAYVLVDVLLLAALYTLRVIAGALAIAVQPSFWLMAFSMSLFTSLALIKRCAELESLRNQNRHAAKGRDYRVADLRQLTGLGTAAANGAVLILALYINSADVTQHYRHAQVLWLLCPLLLYWSGRMWIKTGRGEMHDDPIVYAARDRTSWLIALAGGALIALAL